MTGWIIELFFRRFFSPTGKKYKKWVNPGFLTGPYLPLYGTGLCVMYLLAQIKIKGLEGHPALEKLVLFLVMAAAMTLIEYITGLIFIKGMHVKLWDYTGNWGNIQGIICPMFSFFWAVLSGVYYLLIHPYVLESLRWLSENLAFSFFIGFFYGVFVIDNVYSFNLLVRIRKLADEYDVIVKYEALKHRLIQVREERRLKHHFFLTLHTTRPMREFFEDQLEQLEKFSVRRYHKHSKTASIADENTGTNTGENDSENINP
jgi:uncharacterized membrane protein